MLKAHRARQRDLLGEAELVFCGLEGQPLIESNTVKCHFKPVLANAALPNIIRLYDLRHTHETLLLLDGVHLKIVGERLGHSSVTITLNTYTHVIPSLQREGADKIGARLFGNVRVSHTRAFNRAQGLAPYRHTTQFL